MSQAHRLAQLPSTLAASLHVSSDGVFINIFEIPLQKDRVVFKRFSDFLKLDRLLRALDSASRPNLLELPAREVPGSSLRDDIRASRGAALSAYLRALGSA